MERRRIISVEITEEAAKKYIALFNDNNKFEDGTEVWVNINSTLQCVQFTEDEDGTVIVYDFGVTNDDLRAENRFMVACLTNGDVNHSLASNELDGFGYNPAMNREWLGKWFAGLTNNPPTTLCGMANYFESWDEVRLSKEEAGRVLRVLETI